MYATKHGDCEDMEEILSRNKINIDAQDEEGNTALTIAFQLNAQDKMLLLLENGADKELASKNLSNKKKKALKRLCDQIQPKGKSIDGIIDLLSSSNTSWMANDETEFLSSIGFLASVANKNYEVAKRLLRREYVNIQSSDDKSTALIYAAEDGCSDMVKLLLKNGALINIQNTKGTTALIAATLDGHSNVVKILMDNGADVNIQDNRRNTALIVASQEGHAETVETLLRHKKIKVNIQNINGSTALILAAGWNHIKVVELLLKRPDVNVNIQSTEGATALMCASQAGH
ncbi:ankyrin [Anaeromyces robustus]|uniref:Ankyrin n=1 Tax=Anaeromyces robustus TaxID=1754192 RepID=A0A1Y1XJ28_9FUNG|nr:ankyrin [Anaeromyces robustus]|eukprot:ORX85768.1 ankyrin [Anaeromyces robustus]